MAEAVRHEKTARQLRLLSDALDSGRLGPVRRLVNTLSPAEIGNLLESLPPAKRTVVWGLVDPEDDGEVLVHVGDDVRESLLAEMDPDEIVAAVEDLDIDDLADLVEDLPDTVIDEVLKSMDRENRERLEQVLSYDEDTAGRLMNPDVVTVRTDTTVDVVLRYLRLRGELPDHTDHLYVVSRRHQYLGRIALQSLLTHEPNTPINQLIDDEQPAIGVDESAGRSRAPVLRPRLDQRAGRRRQQHPARPHHHRRRRRHHPRAGRTPGARRRGPGRGRGPVLARCRARSAAACCGCRSTSARRSSPSSVVGQFEGTIEKIVALAVLMPIVAGMGGNAGTQVLALMVRGLALGQVGASNVRRCCGRNCAWR